jgi:endoplasmic reticulum protein 29
MLRAVLVSSLAALVSAYTDRGLLKLDNTTFGRIIDGSRYAFVRFDKEYSYGEEHDAWKDFAKKVGDSSADVLCCDVGVSEYGDKDNSDLAEMYGIKSEDFPQYRLFTKGGSTTEPLKFTGEKKSDEFLKFIQETAGAWIGLPGQVKELDSLAKDWVKGDKAAALKAANAFTPAEKDADSHKYYCKVMTKGEKDADFVTKESARLKKMIDDASVKEDKKAQFGRRLNMLSSFA